jgi:sigma-B regulation protein RsbU (phosphoserine phosphatase)
MASGTDETRRSGQIRGLTEVSRALTYATSLTDVLRLAVDRAAELLEAEQSVVMLTDDDGLLHVRASHGVDEHRVQDFREPLSETLIGRLQGLFGRMDEASFVGVPLVSHGAVIGMLAVFRADGGSCTNTDEWLLSALADQTAVALENARLQEQVREEMHERLRVVQGLTRANERALSTLAHDLRSPLNAIEAYSELLEMGLLGPVVDRQREALGRIRMSGRHLLAVLENVMELAHLSAATVRPQTGSVAAALVAREAVELVQHDATSKDQVLEVETGADLLVRADPDRLRQVLVNLLGNAVKYTPPRGSIRLRSSVIEHQGMWWGALSVSDSGPGIPPDQHEAVFEPYVRLSNNEEEPGTGLGLAICRELVRHMGGHLEVESQVGAGSTFTVRLPLNRSDPPPPG